MKNNLPKANTTVALNNSIENGQFTLDGSLLTPYYFGCVSRWLTTLAGCPQKINGEFAVSHNKLTSLEFGPYSVGTLTVNHNNLTNLKFSPNVLQDLNCHHNNLTSLEGCPKEIRSFNCKYNYITSLKFAPTKITGHFDCSNNELTSLVGAPATGHFDCSNNELTSLVGAPAIVRGFFNCKHNGLTSLEGAPQRISGDFDCSSNNLTSLEGIHHHIKSIRGEFNVAKNPIKSHILGVLKIENLRSFLFNDETVENIINKYLVEGEDTDILDCQEELIEAGYEELALL